MIFFFHFSAALQVRSSARAVNVFQSMNSVIHVSDAKMVVMNQQIYVIQNEFQAYFKGCIHRPDREVVSTVHSNAVMVDVVQQPSFVLVEMDAVTTVTKINVAYAVSINFKAESFGNFL